MEDFLKRRRGPNAARVRRHVATVTAIYSFSLKAVHGEEAGRIVVAIVRAFLAKRGNGMVREDGIGWLASSPHGFFEPVRE